MQLNDYGFVLHFQIGSQRTWSTTIVQFSKPIVLIDQQLVAIFYNTRYVANINDLERGVDIRKHILLRCKTTDNKNNWYSRAYFRMLGDIERSRKERRARECDSIITD